jgi:hypothetical protein
MVCRFDPATAETIATCVATLLTGLMAVGAAVFTVRRTERAARTEARQRQLAIAWSLVAIMDVSSRQATDFGSGQCANVIPWTAFSALAGNVGTLGLDIAKMFITVEQLARDAETPNRDAHAKMVAVMSLGQAILSLRSLCDAAAKQIDQEPTTRLITTN